MPGDGRRPLPGRLLYLFLTGLDAQVVAFIKKTPGTPFARIEGNSLSVQVIDHTFSSVTCPVLHNDVDRRHRSEGIALLERRLAVDSAELGAANGVVHGRNRQRLDLYCLTLVTVSMRFTAFSASIFTVGSVTCPKMCQLTAVNLVFEVVKYRIETAAARAGGALPVSASPCTAL